MHIHRHRVDDVDISRKRHQFEPVLHPAQRVSDQAAQRRTHHPHDASFDRKHQQNTSPRRAHRLEDPDLLGPLQQPQQPGAHDIRRRDDHNQPQPQEGHQLLNGHPTEQMPVEIHPTQDPIRIAQSFLQRGHHRPNPIHIVQLDLYARDRAIQSEQPLRGRYGDDRQRGVEIVVPRTEHARHKKPPHPGRAPRRREREALRTGQIHGISQGHPQPVRQWRAHYDPRTTLPWYLSQLQMSVYQMLLQIRDPPELLFIGPLYHDPVRGAPREDHRLPVHRRRGRDHVGHFLQFFRQISVLPDPLLVPLHHS